MRCCLSSRPAWSVPRWTRMRTVFQGAPTSCTVVYAPPVTSDRRPRRVAFTSVAVVGALLLAACGSHSASSARPELPGQGSTRSATKYEPNPRDFAAMHALLAARARAVLHDD